MTVFQVLQFFFLLTYFLASKGVDHWISGGRGVVSDLVRPDCSFQSFRALRNFFLGMGVCMNFFLRVTYCLPNTFSKSPHPF